MCGLLAILADFRVAIHTHSSSVMLTSKNTHLRNLIHLPFNASFDFRKVKSNGGWGLNYCWDVSNNNGEHDAASVNGRVIDQMVSRSDIGCGRSDHRLFMNTPLVRGDNCR